MTTCGKPTTAHLLLTMAVAAAVVSLSAALPVRETRDAGVAIDINDAQWKLKCALNATTTITRSSSLSLELLSKIGKACEMWNGMTTTLQLSTGNSTDSDEEHIRSSTCKQISLISEFSIIQEDGSCSETVLEYLCSRDSQRDSYLLYGRINIDISNEEYNQWVKETFNTSTADMIIN